MGKWAKDGQPRPFGIQAQPSRTNLYSKAQMQSAEKGFHALCAEIDCQIRNLIDTPRLEGILDDTIFKFTSDYGDILGNHGMAAKRNFYEGGANIPMILSANKGNPKNPQRGGG